MSGRGRRIALGLVLLALLLALGRWGAGFLADRLWEASISDAVATAGARRAFAQTGLELVVVAAAVAWLFLHFTHAARIALPLRRPPGIEAARVWPEAIPRWSVAAGALVLGALLGGGAGNSIDHLRLALDGAPFGVQEPFLDEDLGVFLGSFPFWSNIQNRATLLSVVALGGTVLLHLAGETIRITGRRIRVAPRARGQLAVLLSALALVLAWDSTLEPMRLAAGLQGPLLHSEFVLRSLMAWLETGFGAVAAVTSLFWWVRIPGSVAFVFWMMFGLARIGGHLLPHHTGTAAADPGWQVSTRSLDSVAFQLAGLEQGPLIPRDPAALLPPTLWDDSVIATATGVRSPERGWIAAAGSPHPVWLGMREGQGLPAVVIAVSDDQVTSTGAPLSWEAGAGTAGPGIRPYRELLSSALLVRPGAPRIVIASPPGPNGAGVPIEGWPERLVFAWAWQAAGALSAPRPARIGWRLDPAIRLQAVAPFAQWSTPRLRLLDARVIWQSDGLLVSEYFPGASRIPPPSSPSPWSDRYVSMVRSAFLGLVDGETGAVRIFRRDPSDSLAAAWARISAPLIEPAERIPPALRIGEAYPEELALAQSRVLAGPAWSVGKLDGVGGAGILPPEGTGGAERVVPFVRPGTQSLSAVLVIRRTSGGDSLRLHRLDSLSPIESAAALRQRWERFPFLHMLRDSIRAAGAVFRPGAVRYALAEEGIVAYQPAWAESPTGRPRLALVNVALGPRLGTGRTYRDAWRNLRGEVSPAPVGAGAQAVLDEVRRWWLHADSALKRGDLAELGRALSYLRDLLERQR